MNRDEVDSNERLEHARKFLGLDDEQDYPIEIVPPKVPVPDNKERAAILDAWDAAVPSDNYAPCPCGCGTKWKFVKKEVDKHFDKFVENYKRNKK